ncbi:beta-ketoacyl synthase [Candidatus Nomurabacteria bacterium]|nr:beta-ketoacyl synthase [Candidatus Nomurabacteria bacterium]
MSIPVFIVATGARTPLGMRAAPSAAAYRAGISGMGEHPFMIDRMGEPMPGALDVQLDPGLMGPERLLALAETALREACAPLTKDAQAPGLRLPLYLSLPEIRPGFTEQDAASVRSGFMRFEGLPITISEVNVYTQGHAAGLAALAMAIEQIQQGACETCLVGGVDSYFQPDTMEWLDENRQLAGAVSRSAFVPGEGAGFCLLMTDRACARLGLSVLARVLVVATGRETKLIKTSEICLGEGLTSVVRRAVGGLPSGPERINAVICDINGERYRGEEWGFVCLRLPQYFDDPTTYDSPADCWGDMGAASGPLFVMLACQAATRGYAKGPQTLLWMSSECGLRGAAVLQTTSKI